jgi:hypothetical protein
MLFANSAWSLPLVCAPSKAQSITPFKQQERTKVALNDFLSEINLRTDVDQFL